MLRAVGHLVALSYYVWLVQFIFALRPGEGQDPEVLQSYMDFRLKYFSVWGLTAQVVLLSLCLVHDAARALGVSETNSLRQSTAHLRDIFFAGCAAPLAFTGCLMYAGLCWWDRDLIMPATLDAALPPWLNQAMHTVSAVMVILQLLVDPLGVPCTGAAVTLGSVVSAAYTITMLHEYIMTGRWLYPVLSVLDWPGRVGLTSFTVAIFLVQVVVVKAAIQARWGGRVPTGCPMKGKRQ